MSTYRAARAILFTAAAICAMSCDTLVKKNNNVESSSGVFCSHGADIVAPETGPITVYYRFAKIPESNLDFDINIDETPNLIFSDTGSVASGPEAYSAVYTPPALVSAPMRILIRGATSGGNQGNCVLYVVPAGFNATQIDPNIDPAPYRAPVARFFAKSTETSLSQIDWNQSPIGTFLLRNIAMAPNFAGLTTPPYSGPDVAIRVDANLKIANAATYRLLFRADDNGEMFIDGNSVFQRDASGDVDNQFNVDLTAGVHPIRLHVLNQTGAWNVTLRWQLPSQAAAIIPATFFR